MSATPIFGYLLITLSAALLASHFEQWRKGRRTVRTEYSAAQLRRRTQASALIGVVGAGMIIVQRIPRTPLAMSVYVLSLLTATCLILWLGLTDMWAVHKQAQQESDARLYDELRKHLDQGDDQRNTPLDPEKK